MIEKNKINKVRTIFVFGLLMSLIIGVIAISGCIGGESSDDEAAPAEGVTTTTTGAGTTPTTTSPTTTIQSPTTSIQSPTTTLADTTSPLSDLLGKVKNVDSYKYDMVISTPEMPKIMQSVWVKENKMRTEMVVDGRTMITIANMDKGEVYSYHPKENIAMKMDMGNVPKSAVEDISSIEGYNPTIIGTETLDGKLCTVVEYGSPEGKSKMWIWQKYGFPIQMEMEGPEGTMKMEWRDIEFGDIADSMFELPEGVEIIDIPDMPDMPPGMR